MSQKANHHWHMRRALRLAQKAEGWTKPNPMVGAVLMVGEDRIGEGFHERFGEAHAEINAINNAIKKGQRENLKNAVLYVNLEPCNHLGNTGPCAQAIIEAGIKHVVIASKDPNPKVNESGIKALEDAGVKVEIGINEKDAINLNRFYYKFHEEKRPWITIKAAISLDGTVGLHDEQTKLTGEKTQKQVHILRHKHHAILIGSGTLKMDNPHLGVRLIDGVDPIRIILKGERDLPEDSEVFRASNFKIYEKMEVKELMTKLYEDGIQSVLVEGGPSVFTSFIDAKLVDEINIFLAPILIGKNGYKWSEISEKLSLQTQSVQKWGQDTQLVLTPQWDSNNT